MIRCPEDRCGAASSACECSRRCPRAGSPSAPDAKPRRAVRSIETAARGFPGRCCQSPAETRSAGTAASRASARGAPWSLHTRLLPLRKRARLYRSRAYKHRVSPVRLVYLKAKPCACLEAFGQQPQKYDEPVKLVAFTDYVYSQRGEILYGERAFALFLVSLTAHVEQLTVVGRLNREPRTFHYPLPTSVQFVGLPHYSSLTKPLSVASSLIRSLQRFWRAIDDADAVWLLGPYPHAVAFALLALIRRKHLVLGVRQDFPAYVRSRRPTRRWMHVSADLLELSWRLLARRAPVVVVGPELARHYRHAPAVLEIAVSLITTDDVAAGEERGRPSIRRRTVSAERGPDRQREEPAAARRHPCAAAQG